VGELILICVSSGYLAAIIPVLFVVLFLIQRFYLRTSRQLRLLDLELKSPVYSFFISSFSGLATIRAFSWSDKSYQQHLERLDNSQRPFYLLYSIQRWLMLVLELTVAGICVLLVGLSVAIRDRIDPGLLGVALSNVTTFSTTITQVIVYWTDLETSLGAITRIREFTGSTPQEEQPSSSSSEDDSQHNDKSPAAPATNWPSRGAIAISGLRACYGTRQVLSGIDLTIEAGQKVAVCGRSGSGKSTLLALLLRLYEADAGTVSIDGVDTATLPVRMLRERLAALPQDPLLLAGSVRYNLDPTGQCGDDEMLDALRKAGIGSLVEEKGGLDTEFDPDWFSAGQKQLFCLARVMLRSSRVLLLDEATSSLDHRTDDLIQRLIRKEFAGWTVVVVAHRLKTVADFDKVVVLQGGKVAEFDNPQTLLKKRGLFRNLWDLQES
jgi:ABC-type multidrug transport system fused ATPase/permease subunit